MSLTSEVQGALGRRTWAGGLEGVYANECWSRRSSRRPGAILTAAPPVTEVERQRLVTHMQMTASWFEDEVSGPVADESGVSPVRDLVDDPRGARSSRGGRPDLLEGSAESQAAPHHADPRNQGAPEVSERLSGARHVYVVTTASRYPVARTSSPRSVPFDETFD
jgi:hypothetical protein